MTAKKPTRRRWRCPEGEHPGVLAPQRLRKIDIRRYCLSCSQDTGVLVERVSDVAERQRTTRTEGAKTRRKRGAAAAKRVKDAAAARREQARKVRFLVDGVDLQDELKRLEALPCVVQAYACHERPGVSELVVRRRPGKGTTGTAYTGMGRIVLTIPKACSRGTAFEVLAHELAHVGCADEEWHGAAWRRLLLAIFDEGYGLKMEWPHDADTGRDVPYRSVDSVFERQLIEHLSAHDFLREVAEERPELFATEEKT